ncbi:MAG TPA: VWA domain-containing protein [Pyrinomonadaceae bacterium]|nr:VWA domain-containing protein [Pyrinomonadaceae bacterium]
MLRNSLTTILCFALCVGMVVGQTPASSNQSPDVIKVYTELVQTDVMVFDKQGRFVKNLKREDFELRVDGKAQPIGFFDQIEAGSVDETRQLAAARGESAPSGKSALPLDRGRTVLFFVDDLHLSATSIFQARRLINQFVERDLGQNDEAEIVTSSGQLGFLQQPTDNRTVLRLATERLNSRTSMVKDLQRPHMSEYQALQIDRGDRDVMAYFVAELLAENRMMGNVEEEVKRRASAILHQAASYSTITLSALESLTKSCATISGRKLLFLISDGFFIDTRNSDTTTRMRMVTTAAARAGVVIYSIDARGLIATLDDASDKKPIDSRLSRGGQGEIGASQDILNAVAQDTGGRALFDRNDLYTAVDNGLKETASYYLLGWRPQRESESSKFRRLEVSVVGKPDLTVRLRKGFYDLEAPAAERAKPATDKAATEEAAQKKLREALMTPHPERGLPLSIDTRFLNTAGQTFALTSSIEIPGDFVAPSSPTADGAQFEVVGAVFTDRGEVGDRFTLRLGRKPASDESLHDLSYSHTTNIGPGLYQVRVAVRNLATGQIGTANKWIEIPDLSKGSLTLSSLLLGERDTSIAVTATSPADNLASVPLSVSHRFKSGSFLRYVVFIYNASRAINAQFDCAAQVIVLREGQPVATTTLKKIATDNAVDPSRLAYAAELPLEGFHSGQYLLRFVVIDRLARTSALQQARFSIE